MRGDLRDSGRHRIWLQHLPNDLLAHPLPANLIASVDGPDLRGGTILRVSAVRCAFGLRAPLPHSLVYCSTTRNGCPLAAWVQWLRPFSAVYVGTLPVLKTFV